MAKQHTTCTLAVYVRFGFIDTVMEETLQHVQCISLEEDAGMKYLIAERKMDPFRANRMDIIC
jgi:hypothetical protein